MHITHPLSSSEAGWGPSRGRKKSTRRSVGDWEMAQSSMCLGHRVHTVSKGVETSRREVREMPGSDSGLTMFLSRTWNSLLTFENYVPCGGREALFLKKGKARKPKFLFKCPDYSKSVLSPWAPGQCPPFADLILRPRKGRVITQSHAKSSWKGPCLLTLSPRVLPILRYFSIRRKKNRFVCCWSHSHLRQDGPS